MARPVRVIVFPVRAYVIVVSVVKSPVSAPPCDLLVTCPKIGPLPGSLPVSAHVTCSRGGRIVAVQAHHSGVAGGNAVDRCAIAFSIGWRGSGGRPSGPGSWSRGGGPPRRNAWKSTNG